MSERDDQRRGLTASELLERDQRAPFLVAVQRYLSCPAGQPVGRLEVARAGQRPVAAPRRANAAAGPTNLDAYASAMPGSGFDGWIHPGYVRSVLYARGDGNHTVADIAEALGYMGARPASTMLPRDEVEERHSPYRTADVAEWMRVSAEMVARIRMANYTPVLTRLPGTTPRRSPYGGESAAQAARAAIRLSPDVLLRVLRSLLRDVEPTVAMTVAREGRPLMMRMAGRGPSHTMRIQPDHAALSPQAAATYLAGPAAVTLGIRSVTEQAMRRSFDEAARTYPLFLEPMTRVRVPDLSPPQQRVSGWLRVRLSGLGLPEWSSDQIEQAVVAFRDGQQTEQTEQTEQRA